MALKKNTYRVIVENGIQFLTYKGEKLPNQIETSVVQSMPDITKEDGVNLCTISIKVIALLEDTK